MTKKIELTQQELEDIKDTAAFRARLLIFMKHHEDLPKKVNSLEIHRGIHYFLLTIVLSGIFGIFWYVIRNT